MKTIKNFLLKNLISIVYVFLSVILELLAVFVTSGKFFIHNPLIYLTYVAIAVTITSSMTKQSLRRKVAFCFLLFNAIADLVFITIFSMTSGTLFDFEMLNLSKDGMGVAEKFIVNFTFLSTAGFSLSAFFIGFKYFEDKLPAPTKFNYTLITTISLSVIIFLGQCGFAYSIHNDTYNDLNYILYKKESNDYAEQGILGNMFSEVHKTLFYDNVALGNTEELDSFIYNKVTTPTETMGGKAKDFNLIVILAESLEWFSFINDQNLYPNGHTASEEMLRKTFPNLYSMYDESYVLSNFHSREKTDIAENYSYLGNYPTGVYINYNFPDNSLPYSYPNVLKNLYGVDTYGFHNGEPNFYNRTHFLTKSVGLKNYIASDNMDITNYTLDGERNLDSQMIEACKTQMFPTDKRFSTHITTITMHGQYAERNNIKNHYDTLINNGIFDSIEHDDEMQEMFRHYVATALELDKAIGVMNNYLKETGLDKNTMIVMFGDHNAYYSDLSAYVKGLESVNTTKTYTKLFNVPLFVKVGNETPTNRFINKFTCTADIVPTIYDLLGISYYSNIFYGNSAFSNQESLLYSRAYEVFISDKTYFYSLNNVIWQDDSVDKTYIDQTEEKALNLIDKIEHVNRIFYHDFLSKDNATKFNEKMLEINN